MATRLVKDIHGTICEVDESQLGEPWYRDKALWTQIAVVVGLIFNGYQSSAARNYAKDADRGATDVKREVQTQLPPLTGRPPVTSKPPEQP